jgi:type II secretory ATPase GspE/PulE/Tfp pilus assembly ATPase PilB-like protein
LCATKDKYFLNKAALATLEKSVDLNKVLATLKEEKIVAAGDTWEKIPFYKPRPSTESKDGYSGRVGIHETLKVSPAIKELILRGSPSNVIEIQARKEGMLTMLEDGIFKAVEGITTVEEVFRVVSE